MVTDKKTHYYNTTKKQKIQNELTTLYDFDQKVIKTIFDLLRNIHNYIVSHSYWAYKIVWGKPIVRILAPSSLKSTKQYQNTICRQSMDNS